MRSLPIIVLGLVFAVGGLILAGLTFRKPAPPAAPLKKSEVRAKELEHRDAIKLRLGGAIHGIAGASLSARAVTTGVRRSLALYQVLVRDAGHGIELGSTPPAGAAGAPAGSAGGR